MIAGAIVTATDGHTGGEIIKDESIRVETKPEDLEESFYTLILHSKGLINCISYGVWRK